jgi:hypothetical protein
MALLHGAPPPELAIELSEVRADATLLAEALKQVNAPLPDSFPKLAVIEVANALRELPDGTARGCLRPLSEAQSQLAIIRSQHIVHDDHADSKVSQDHPPLFRGEPVDQKLRSLMSSVSTALQTASRLAVEEPELEEPEAGVEPPKDASRGLLIEQSSKAQKEFEEERRELDSLTVPNSQHSDTLRRRLTDVLILNSLGRGELRMRRIVSTRLRRIGSALQEYPVLLRQSAELIAKGTDVAEYAYHKWHELEERIFGAGTSTIREIANDIANYARKLEARRRDGRAPIQPTDPPADFDIEEAAQMIHAGTAPPSNWRPFIHELPLGNRRLRTLTPLAGLTNLRRLTKVSVYVADISAIAGLVSLEELILDNTQVRDLSALKGLTLCGNFRSAIQV